MECYFLFEFYKSPIQDFCWCKEQKCSPKPRPTVNGDFIVHTCAKEHWCAGDWYMMSDTVSRWGQFWHQPCCEWNMYGTLAKRLVFCCIFHISSLQQNQSYKLLKLLRKPTTTLHMTLHSLAERIKLTTGILCIFQMGDLQTSYIVIQKSLQAYPSHVDSKELLEKLQKYFAFIWIQFTEFNLWRWLCSTAFESTLSVTNIEMCSRTTEYDVRQHSQH